MVDDRVPSYYFVAVDNILVVVDKGDIVEGKVVRVAEVENMMVVAAEVGIHNMDEIVWEERGGMPDLQFVVIANYYYYKYNKVVVIVVVGQTLSSIDAHFVEEVVKWLPVYFIKLT